MSVQIAAFCSPAFYVMQCGLAFEGTPCDLWLPVVDPAHVDEVAADITRSRGGLGAGNVVPLALGLTAPQTLALLAAGAFDFIHAPLDAGETLVRLCRAAGAMPTVPATPLPRLTSSAMHELVGSSPAFAKQLALLPTIAGCDAGVLILGETGTGKEVYARAVHYSSARASRPLVAVNCGAIPSELLESELFGHVRGAFTHAIKERAGLVREAEGGTLLLDEIDALPLSAQVKLLRFVQAMEFRPVGADAMRHADVRVIAASNQDLAALVDRGAFRRDLYFRLNLLTVTLPPLRERTGDIGMLALRFIQRFARSRGRATLGLSPQALKRLLAHDWPGNVRELEHVIERAVLLAPGPTILPDDLQLQLQSAGATAGADESFRAAKARIVESFERGYIERLLASCGGNITLAAQVARKNRRALFELIRKRGIQPEQFRPDGGIPR